MFKCTFAIALHLGGFTSFYELIAITGSLSFLRVYVGGKYARVHSRQYIRYDYILSSQKKKIIRYLTMIKKIIAFTGLITLMTRIIYHRPCPLSACSEQCSCTCTVQL